MIEITFNPDILPTKEEWRLVCEMVKQQPKLTDEEIDELANKYLYVLNDVPYANNIKDFARAILKKASEK